MLKREFIQHIRRLWRILLITILAYFMVSAFIMQSIASNIRLLYSSDSWIELLPLVYNLFYGVTVCFFVLIFFYYILRTLFDYRQGKTRWMLLAYTQKPRIVADALLLAILLLVFYLISLTILYFGFQYHLQLLENQHLFLPEKYQSFTTMLSMQLAFPFLYPTSVTSNQFLCICCYRRHLCDICVPIRNILHEWLAVSELSAVDVSELHLMEIISTHAVYFLIVQCNIYHTT